MKILIKYATRQRPEKFIEALTNIKSTIGYAEYFVMVSADTTDGSMDDELMQKAYRIIPNMLICKGDNQSKIQAINADMDKAPSDWQMLVNMSDDMYFTVNGWGDRMIEHIQWTFGDTTDFFAHFNDGYVHERLTTMSIIGREYYNRDGYIYFPKYRSFSCDAEAMLVAIMRGRYHYFKEIYFNHIHPANVRIPSDQLYRNNARHSSHDEALYFQRRRNLFYESNPTCVPFDPYNRGEGDLPDAPYSFTKVSVEEVQRGSGGADLKGQSGTVHRGETKQTDGLGFDDESYPSGIY